MVKEEVRDLFIRRGFIMREVISPDYQILEHNGEAVGCIYDTYVYLAHIYPSLNKGPSKRYANTPKNIIDFTSPVSEFEEAIAFLLDSPNWIDRETRDVRVAKIREYFNRRKPIEERIRQRLME